MGWSGGVSILEALWPHIQDVVPDPKARERIYSVLCYELEMGDCDTLEEAAYGDDVDPVLLRVLEQRGHIGEGPDEWTEEEWDAATGDPYPDPAISFPDCREFPS